MAYADAAHVHIFSTGSKYTCNIQFYIMYHVWVYSVRLDLLSVAYSNQTLNVNNKSLRWVIMGHVSWLLDN